MKIQSFAAMTKNRVIFALVLTLVFFLIGSIAISNKEKEVVPPQISEFVPAPIQEQYIVESNYPDFETILEWEEMRWDLRPIVSNTCNDINFVLGEAISARYVSTVSGNNTYETASIEGAIEFDSSNCQLTVGEKTLTVIASDYDQGGRLYVEVDGQFTSVDSPHPLGEHIALYDNNGEHIGNVVVNRGSGQ